METIFRFLNSVKPIVPIAIAGISIGGVCYVVHELAASQKNIAITAGNFSLRATNS